MPISTAMTPGIANTTNPRIWNTLSALIIAPMIASSQIAPSPPIIRRPNKPLHVYRVAEQPEQVVACSSTVVRHSPQIGFPFSSYFALAFVPPNNHLKMMRSRRKLIGIHLRLADGGVWLVSLAVDANGSRRCVLTSNQPMGGFTN